MIVTYHGDVETTSFFMTQIEKELRAEGFDVRPLYYGAYSEEAAVEGAVFLTFNFAGLYSKDGCFVPAGSDGGIQLVDRYRMKCVNIIVDHPYHYHDFLQEQLQLRADRYYQYCIDRVHIAYMERYFPKVRLSGFLPSGGVAYSDVEPAAAGDVKWQDRPIDLLFAGTYVPPEGFELFIGRNGPEYSAFYHSMLDEALSDPDKRLEEIVRRRLIEEVEDEVSEDQIRETLGHIQFLDYYVRYRRRGEVIRYLADWESSNGDGLHLTIVGSGWESLMEELVHPERVTLMPYADSRSILQLLSQSRFSLNVLPSFHEGGHDRIFNSMLCGAVCVTDSNSYLDGILQGGKNAVLYDTPSVMDSADAGSRVEDGSLEELAAYLYRALTDRSLDEEMNRIRAHARETASFHTWKQRSLSLAGALRDIMEAGS